MQETEKNTASKNRKPAQTESAAAQEKKSEAAAPVFTQEQVQAMIDAALAKYAEEHKTEPVKAQQQEDGIVTIIWQAEVNDANQLMLGPNGKYGMVTGKHAIIAIPHRDFVSDFRTSTMQYFLKTRNLIVLNGLTDDERVAYGLEYRQGEYLEPAVYERLIEMGDAVAEIFPKLHPTWREMVATKFTDAYENKTLKCSREALLEMNRISRKDYANLPKGDVRRKGCFWAIIHAMNADDEAGDIE